MMAKNTVTLAGSHTAMQTDGRYSVCFFWRLEDGRMQDQWYTDLSWPEALSALVEEMDCHRPGWALGDGWHQPALPYD
jgi:hypothetical protein